MAKGWVKLHRQLVESDVWGGSLVGLKLWAWIMLSVDRETGTLSASLAEIADKIAWEANKKRVVPHKETVKRELLRMQRLRMIDLTEGKTCDGRVTGLSVCKWSSYQDPSSAHVTPPKHYKQEVQEVPLVPQPETKAPKTKPRERDPWLDEMAEMYADISSRAGVSQLRIPYALFAKWRKEFGEELPLEMTKRCYLADKHIEGNPAAYLMGACMAERSRRAEEDAGHEWTAPPGIEWLAKDTGRTHDHHSATAAA